MGDSRTYGNLNRNIANRAGSTIFDSYKGKRTNLDIKIAQVIDIILDESHPKYNNPTDLRKIEFGVIADNSVDESFKGLATPLSGEINTLPLKNELVVILVNNSNKGNSSYYYIANVNLFNNGLYNPNGYDFQVDNQDRLDLGKNVDEDVLSKVRKLILSPGDVSIEGKFGNSIRLGNSNELNFNGQDIKTPYDGDNNKPITIIRNGQKSVDSLLPIFEDINEDHSSIYLTSNQIISIDVASKNLETFNIELKEVITDNDIFNITNNNKDLNSEVTPVLPPTNPQLISPEPIDDSSEDIEGKFRSIIDVLKSNIKAPLDKFFGNGQVESKEYNPNNPNILTKVTKNLIGLPSNAVIINASEPYLVKEAIEPFIKLMRDFYNFNLNNPNIPNPTIVINGIGRSIEMQISLYKRYLNGGNLAAKPGKSNHGWNTAIDISWFDSRGKYIKSSQRNGWNEKGFLSEQYEWLFKNAPKYGFLNPKGLRDGIRNEEFWHWEYWGTGIKSKIKQDPLSLGAGVINLRWTEENFSLDPSVKNPIDYKTGKESNIV